jgi:NadR type nicotinamide-nucleotide adenylyltransferase
MAARVGSAAGRDARTGGDVRHGLVVGKFYPPHAGHHHLIDTAAAACERLTVVVAASPLESIPIALRAAWLRERHSQPHVEIVPAVDDIPVDYDSDTTWAAHVAVFRAAAGGPVDVVFSSEEYGPELARRLDAVHVPGDPARERFPVSGTAVRADPVACWEWLSPAVRAHLARRVVVVGAESSGTTTLARALASHYARRGGVWAATRWVPEYGRLYCEEKLAVARRRDPHLWLGDLGWTSEEFTVIAERQRAWEESAARSGSPLLVCDTDAFATELWHERYVGTPAPHLAGTHHDLWILTDTTGVPFEQDGWRDGEAVREAMSARFAEELEHRRLPHVVVAGPHGKRLYEAIEAIDALIVKGWTFTDPR